MKIRAILILFLFYSGISYAQEIKYDHFLNFLTHIDIPQSITDECSWQIAIVTMRTDVNGRVVNYSLLGKTTDELKKMYHPLLGYKFPKKMHVYNKTFVFCQTFINENSDCFKNRQMTAEDGVQIIYPILIHQFELQPNTVFLPYILTNKSLARIN